MEKDSKKESAPQPYTGPFLFINKTSTTLAKSRDETFIISSHVSKTHRKWQKEERLKRLHASSAKAVVQQAILPAKPEIQAVGSSRLAPPESHAPARTGTDSNQPQTSKSTSGANAYDKAGLKPNTWISNYFPGTKYSQPVYPFEGSQENDDQERKGENKGVRASNRASLAPFRGNSDPFSAAALPLTARDHDIIRQAQHFFVFVAWPDKRSAVWRAPIADTSSSHIRIRQTLTDEAEVHAILAAGYAVKAEVSECDSSASLARVLFHKAKAVELLRDRLVKHGFSQSVTTLIRLLISLDFHACDNEAALVHLRGLWAMASTTPGILVDAQELLRVSDAWISISLLKRPEISPDRYDPGERRLQSFDEALRTLEREHCIFVFKQLGHNSHAHSALDGRTWTLLEAAQEIVNTKDMMDKIEDPEIMQQVIQWMNGRTSAVTGFLTTGYVDNTEAAESEKLHGPERVTKTLMSAACLCAMMYMNFKFLDLPTNYNFSKTCQKIEQILRFVSKRLAYGSQKEQDSDYLWLVFLATMGNDIFAARGDIPYSPWLVTEFHSVCERLNVPEQCLATAVLRRYPHYAEMDIFIIELFLHKAPTTHIISWPRWCAILNHT